MSQWRLRLVFAGTPEFALPGLDAAIDSGHDVVAVYTQPDRPAGRGRRLSASPIKQRALDAGIEVRQPESLRSAGQRAALSALAPDLMIVIAYGLILPRGILAIPGHGCWNVHASLLPRWRGAAPIQRAILAGDAQTGVCLMKMEAGLDTGPVLIERATAITEADTGASLHDRLAALGAQVLAEGLAAMAEGRLPTPQPQPELGITYAHKLDKAEARLDPGRPAVELARAVRAFDPWPGAEIELAGEIVRIWRAQAVPGAPDARPGQILRADRDGIDLACADGVLRVLELQRPGGRRISVGDYLNGRPALTVQPA